jgi:membrane associated rhomboid family serine protease
VLIPIGHEEHKVARLPWVTIALIVANVAIFLFTHKVAEQQAVQANQQAQEIVRYVAQRPYLSLPPEIRGVAPAKQPPADLAPWTMAEEQATLDRMWEQIRGVASGGIYQKYGFIPARPNLLGLFACMFLHAGWLHLIGNMLFLWLAGAALEDRWGRIFFPALYLVSGVIGTLAHGVAFPQSQIPMVGASGAIAGLMGAFLVRLGTSRIRFFYWIFLFTGTFALPAWLALPLWLAQQFWLAKAGAQGIAVWAHIGGFAVGAFAAAIIWVSGFEARVLSPAVTRKTSWAASGQFTTALAKLDAGDADGAIRELVGLLRSNPNSVEARATLVDAYVRKEDRASAGRESARLVGAYLVARDMEGALAALEEHQKSYPETPLRLRDSLAIAGHREKQGQVHEAAALYREALAVCPDDPLTPKALVAFGRLLLEVLNQPDEAAEILEQVADHPKVTPVFAQASQELLGTIRTLRAATLQAAPAEGEPPTPPELSEPHSTYGQIELHPETSHDMPQLSTEATLELSGPGPDAGAPEAPAEPPYMLGLEDEPPVQPSLGFAEPEPTPPPEPEPAEPTYYLSLEDEPPPEPAPPVPEPKPARKLVPIAMRAVGIDARGLHLEDHDGKTGRMPWQEVAGLAVASLGDATSDPSLLVVDLLMGPLPATGVEIQTVRITGADLAIPQLASEPPLRAVQRLVATILKTSGATPFPNREACLGTRGFPEFPDLAAYEADLIAQLPPAGDPTA